jgi:2'-5' RNA ligase
MSDTTRTFIAVAVPATLEARLAHLQSRLASLAPEARWTTARPWHVTLAFLGDVPHSELTAVCRAAAETASQFAPFELVLQGVGAFPDEQRPRVVWAGVSGAGVEALLRVQTDLSVALATLNYPAESHPFRPHVTLGRLSPRRGRSRDLSGPLRGLRDWAAGPFRVEEVVTFASSTTDGGLAYTPLARAHLPARKTELPA